MEIWDFDTKKSQLDWKKTQKCWKNSDTAMKEVNKTLYHYENVFVQSSVQGKTFSDVSDSSVCAVFAHKTYFFFSNISCSGFFRRDPAQGVSTDVFRVDVCNKLSLPFLLSFRLVCGYDGYALARGRFLFSLRGSNFWLVTLQVREDFCCFIWKIVVTNLHAVIFFTIRAVLQGNKKSFLSPLQSETQ